jgi:hypothetical protein
LRSCREQEEEEDLEFEIKVFLWVFSGSFVLCEEKKD